MPANEHPDDHSMSFGDHLEELRRRILWSLAVPLPLAIVTFIFSDPLIEWLYRPLDGVLETSELPRRLQALGPAEVLVVKLKLSLIFAAVLSAPWILWQAWLFVRPGLFKHERRFVYFLIPGSTVLTVIGLGLMYFVMLPLMLQMLILFGTSLQLGHSTVADDPRVAAVLEASPSLDLRLEDPATARPGDAWLIWPQLELHVAVVPADPENAGPVEIIRVPSLSGSIISQEFRLTTYINFVLILLLGIAVAFQMPLVIQLMAWLGLISATQLGASRKYAILACAATAAVITPADVMSMIIMFIPLVALYELSILMVTLVPASAVAEGTVFGRRFGSKRSKESEGDA